MEVDKVKERMHNWLQMELPFIIPLIVRYNRKPNMEFEDFSSYFSKGSNRRFCNTTFETVIRRSKSQITSLEDRVELIKWYEMELPREAYRLYTAGTYKR